MPGDRAAASQAAAFSFTFSFLQEMKSSIAEGVKSYMFFFCAAVQYFKVFFEWEKIIPKTTKKNLLVLKTPGFSHDTLRHESIKEKNIF